MDEISLHTTRISLIKRLQTDGEEGWEEFLQTYVPVMHRWLRTHRISPPDAEDISQEVLIRLSQKLPGFEHNGSPGAFRKWMHQITLNVMRNFRRAKSTRPMVSDHNAFEKVISQLEDPTSDLSREFHRQHNLFVLERLIENLGESFSAENLDIFRRYCILDEDPTKIAADMGVSKNAVYVAKFRIIRALKSSIEDVSSMFLTGDPQLEF